MLLLLCINMFLSNYTSNLTETLIFFTQMKYFIKI